MSQVMTRPARASAASQASGGGMGRKAGQARLARKKRAGRAAWSASLACLLLLAGCTAPAVAAPLRSTSPPYDSAAAGARGARGALAPPVIPEAGSRPQLAQRSRLRRLVHWPACRADAPPGTCGRAPCAPRNPAGPSACPPSAPAPVGPQLKPGRTLAEATDEPLPPSALPPG